MTVSSAIIKEARSWLSTPYQHQAKVKGVGVDCVGLIIAVGVKLNLVPDELLKIDGYARTPNPKHMQRIIEKNLDSITQADVMPGDIAWIQWRKGLPMHMGFISCYNGKATILHALSTAGMVTEHTLSKEWSDRVLSYWRFRGIS